MRDNLYDARTKLPRLVAILFALALAVFAQDNIAQATTLTVCETGCDHVLLQDAINAASSGDTIQLFAEVYKPYSVSPFNVANIRKNLTIQGAGRSSTTLNGDGDTTAIFVGSNIQVILRDLAVTNSFAAGISVDGTVTLTRVDITGNKRIGLNLDSDASATLNDVVVSGNGIESANHNAIDNFGTLTINGGQVTSNHGTGIRIGQDAEANLDNVLVANNGHLEFTTSGIKNDGTLTANNVTIVDNRSLAGAGIQNVEPGTATITNSTISRNVASNNGGAIRNFSTLIIEDSAIASNSTFGNGGAIINHSEITIRRTTLRKNTSVLFGGGIQNRIDGELTIEDSTIEENTSNTEGGGLFNTGTVTISRSNIIDNEASNDGGGIYDDGGTIELVDSTVSGNTSANGEGGGLYNFGTFTATSSTFSDNTSRSQGGGIFNDSGALTISHTTFTGNSANAWGGGIYSDGIATISNSTFSGNEGTDGGAILNHPPGNLALSSVTITQTTSNNSTGGALGDEGGIVTITNSLIVNQQSGAACRGLSSQTDFQSGGSNIVGDGTCELTDPTDQQGVTDSRISETLEDNGGPTLTHSLLPGSPAINGVAGDCPSETDQRGSTRIQDGKCDVGAYEVVPLDVSVSATGPDTVPSNQEVVYDFTTTYNNSDEFSETQASMTLTVELPENIGSVNA